jgi:hypothetical protein
MTEEEQQPDAEIRSILAKIEYLCGEVPPDLREFLIERRRIFIANGGTWAPHTALDFGLAEQAAPATGGQEKA